MNIHGGWREPPLEGPTEEDNLNTQCVSVGLTPIQNEGQEGAGRPKMVAQC